MNVTIRKFHEKDIENKVRWINDSRNNKYLHYEVPLEIEKTKKWFIDNKDKANRYDAVIEADGIPVGLIGLLSIDMGNKKAEYYVVLGEHNYCGHGVAFKATNLILRYAFEELQINRVYLFTETDNVSAIKLYEKSGFKREGMLKNDLVSKGRFVDRYLYGITKSDFYNIQATPIQCLGMENDNCIYMKRDDLIPYSFGGNKARKAKLFFEEIDKGCFDYVVTYGSSSSNHCRIVANMAATRNIKCKIISPEEVSKDTFNKKMMELFGAEIIVCTIDCVSETIDNQMELIKDLGYKPYFIPGGGHGNIGTQAYVDCYEEIRCFEKKMGVFFDYIFLASGTGTTQAGLVCGQIINRDIRKIVGISIARKNPKGRNIIKSSCIEYFAENRCIQERESIDKTVNFVDDYIGNGYGMSDEKIDSCIRSMLIKHGIPMDSTYTGKAFRGMCDYLKKNGITDKQVLFIHTGGTPLYFDDLLNGRGL